jgi:hypothetical protein
MVTQRSFFRRTITQHSVQSISNHISEHSPHVHDFHPLPFYITNMYQKEIMVELFTHKKLYYRRYSCIQTFWSTKVFPTNLVKKLYEKVT